MYNLQKFYIVGWEDMAKKSFFEKLTGSIKIRNQNDDNLPEEPIKEPVEEIEEPEEPQEGGYEENLPEKPEETEENTEMVENEEIINEEPMKIVMASTKKIEIPTKRIKNSKSKKELAESPEEAEGQLTIDVYQTDSDVVIKSTIAGVRPEDVDVSITNDMVTIRGSRKKDEEVHSKDYYYQECYWGSFSRSVILPVDVVAEKAEATIKNGILTVKLPKADKIKTKKIQVKGA